MREDSAGSEPQQRNGDGEKGKMIKKNDRKQPGERKLQQQGGEATQGNSGQQSLPAQLVRRCWLELGERFVYGRHESGQSNRTVVGRWLLVVRQHLPTDEFLVFSAISVIWAVRWFTNDQRRTTRDQRLDFEDHLRNCLLGSV